MLKFLKSDEDFAAFKASKLVSGQFLKIRIHYSLNQNTPRFGFIIPKKVLPKVVDRNLLKRRIKFFLTKALSKVKPADVIFYPQKTLLKQKFTSLSKEIDQLFTKAKLWK